MCSFCAALWQACSWVTSIKTILSSQDFKVRSWRLFGPEFGSAGLYYGCSWICIQVVGLTRVDWFVMASPIYNHVLSPYGFLFSRWLVWTWFHGGWLQWIVRGRSRRARPNNFRILIYITSILDLLVKMGHIVTRIKVLTFFPWLQLWMGEGII